MLDIWHTFPATMGEEQAWITYNHSYAEIAKTDKRNNFLRIKVTFKKPTAQGMPTNEEFSQLLALDKKLDKDLTGENSIYVGRITVGGRRYFYYYASATQEKAKQIITEAERSSAYKLDYTWQKDPEKQKYWDDLYPTEDDWQVIKDLEVLDALAKNSDNKDIKREVQHWAYFTSDELAVKFKNWVINNGYKFVKMGKTDNKKEFMIKFSHVGTMNLGDITHHTIILNRKAAEFGGSYDGWETSVEK